MYACMGHTGSLTSRLLSSCVQVNLEGVLRLVTSFRPLEPKQEMALSANALMQLEVLAAGQNDGSSSSGSARGSKGSLLHLMDCTLTPFGARLLRRWVSRPLTDRGLIVQRLDAVDELAGRAGGAAGESQALTCVCSGGAVCAAFKPLGGTVV
jgi:DNA mismatch repair ATPase MutS